MRCGARLLKNKVIKNCFNGKKLCSIVPALIASGDRSVVILLAAASRLELETVVFREEDTSDDGAIKSCCKKKIVNSSRIQK